MQTLFTPESELDIPKRYQVAAHYGGQKIGITIDDGKGKHNRRIDPT